MGAAAASRPRRRRRPARDRRAAADATNMSLYPASAADDDAVWGRAAATRAVASEDPLTFATAFGAETTYSRARISDSRNGRRNAPEHAASAAARAPVRAANEWRNDAPNPGL